MGMEQRVLVGVAVSLYWRVEVCWLTCVLSVNTGYIEAAIIPAGARRIRVVEDKPAHSFLGKTKMFDS